MAREEAEIKELSKKLSSNPDSMVFVQLADAYRRAGDLEQSVQVCQQGLERHPTYTTARAILGRNFLDLGRLDEAEAEFRKIEAADPENIMAHRMLGQISMQKGRYAEAISRQQRVLSLDPEDSTAQELLQEALLKSKESPSSSASAGSGQASSPARAAEAPKGASGSDQSGTIKVAEIYIKKGALDEAAEVLQEVLASDPDNALARQKLQEVNERRGKAAGAAAADDGARQKAEAEAEAKRKADQEAAAKKAADDARAQAEAAKKKAEDEAKAKADADAKAKAEADEREKAAAKAKADQEAKAREDAAAAERQKTEAKAKADAEAREQEAKDRKASKLSSDDILSVMTASSDDLIGEDHPSGAAEKTAAASGQAPGLSPEARKAIDDFLRAQAMEASMLLDTKGKVLESKVTGDATVLGATAGAIFSNTEKAAQRMAFGALKQIMIVGEDGRQILFVALKAGVLVALTGRNTNLGLLRVAVNDLVKRA